MAQRPMPGKIYDRCVPHSADSATVRLLALARGCDCSSAPKAQSNFQAGRPTMARSFLSAVVCLLSEDLICIPKEFAEGQIFAAFSI